LPRNTADTCVRRKANSSMVCDSDRLEWTPDSQEHRGRVK
jgi:hypothetical protein